MPKAALAITVRMYRQGLGDCFLLTFKKGSKTAHMMIDCGVILSTQDAAARMTRIVEDVRDATNGHLDVVVATHEHWDHISGFNQARPVFDQIEIDSVWLAWTEEPGNERAQELKEEFGAQMRAIVGAMNLWKADVQPRLREAVTEVLAFSGDVLGAAGQTTADALAYLKGREDAEVRYLRPGQTPFGVPGIDGIRVYVLGPPDSSEYIRHLLPRKNRHEAYELRLTAARAFGAAFNGNPGDGERRRALPFDEYHMIPKDQALSRGPGDFFSRHYGDPAAQWRAIDDDWLTLAGQLALDLDNKTNNTCLALAIEIESTGEVLLFPGDAQIGNWASWKDVSFDVRSKDGSNTTVTSRDLLARTVLYKVGHHGSHNATHRSEGLEMMTNPDLVAMIPVNRAMARKKRWNMPFPPLLERLNDKCRSRVIHQDDPPGAAVQAARSVLSKGETARFTNAIVETDDYVEFTFPF